MKLAHFGLSDVGKKREKNEDSFLIDPDLGLFMVADGMGGHLGGEYASRMAVKTVREILKKLNEDPEATLSVGQTERYQPGDQLKCAIRIASQRIFREASRSSNLRGMGTTTVALYIRDDKGYLANVGDSRGYLIRTGEIRQLTVDHSLVTEQLHAGFITQEEVKNHKLKNIITRSVGFQDEVEIDLVVRDLEAGDSFLLCSDGLTNLVSDREILKQAAKARTVQNPKAICEKLVGLANRRGGDDNITVLFISVE